MKIRWWQVSIVFCVLLVLTLVVFLRDPQKPQCELSDGTIIRFEKASFGSMPYDSYSPVKALLSKYIPASLQRFLGGRRRVTFNTDPNGLALLFSYWEADGKTPRIISDRGEEFDCTRLIGRIEFVESTGFVFNARTSWGSTSGNLLILSQSRFPRRDRMLQMRCYEGQTDKLVLETRVLNPAYQQIVNEWEPKPIPISQTVPPVTVTLQREPGEFFVNYLRDEDMEIDSNDRSWIEPAPQKSAWFSDATGNQTQSLLSELSPFEPAWKLHVQIRRNSFADFSADERWRSNPVSFPNHGTAARVVAAGSILGVDCDGIWVSSAGALQLPEAIQLADESIKVSSSAFVPLNLPVTRMEHPPAGTKDLPRIHSGVPFICLVHNDVLLNAEVIAQVRDQDDKLIPTDLTVYGLGTGKSVRVYLLKQFEGITQIEIEMIVNRSLQFEFFVKPPAADVNEVQTAVAN